MLWGEYTLRRFFRDPSHVIRGITMKRKISAVITAIIMVAVVAFSVIQVTDDSEATAIGNTTTVYLIDGTTVSSTTLYSYDLYQALVSASTTSGFALNGVTTTQKTVTYGDGATVVTQNSSWNQKIHTGYTQAGAETYYYNPNEDYGTLASVTIGETAYTNFNVYVYQKEVDETTYSWETPLSAIGWYHPFADYSATYTASGKTYSLSVAAIAITVNGGNCSSITTTVQTPVSITSSTDNCLYTFLLKGENATAAIGKNVIVRDDLTGQYVTQQLTSQNLINGITIYGWGSNAHEALNIALQGQLSVQTDYATYHVSTYGNYYTYYGWYDDILGVQTQIIVNPDGSYTYHWWQTSIGTDTNLPETEYSLSYYSGLSGAPNAGTTFQVAYV